MSGELNSEAQLAFDFIRKTNTNIFLTGKAGTGKTTFLKKVKREIHKRSAVVAPTGVAAINAEGMTIHSLFQLPFGPIVPNQKGGPRSAYKFNRKKIKLIKSLDLLIIDEISMVRCDVLDAIDAVLKRFRDRDRPFGGLQLLLIGDLNQLSPVVKPDEWRLLSPYYNNEYFFSSLALQQSDFKTIELQHIYRQSDPGFVNLLNKVRNHQLDDEAVSLLNSRYREDIHDDSGYITLTSHNRSAVKINSEKLDSIDSKSYKYSAQTEGNFPENSFPNDDLLELKKGAQVIFIKNDSSEDKLYYNGKIGRVTDLGEDFVEVLCDGDEDSIIVNYETWENTKFELDETDNEVKSTTVGVFRQMPLKAAWAITIHKSQGLTFDKVIIDAQDAFAHGQVYVALSRCRTFEGIILRSKIEQKSIVSDQKVSQFNQNAYENQPGKTELFEAQIRYQQQCLNRLFEMKSLRYSLQNLERTLKESSRTLNEPSVQKSLNILSEFNNKIVKTALAFSRQLGRYFKPEILPEENNELLERLKKAGSYYVDIIQKDFHGRSNEIGLITDNKEVEKKIKEKKTEFLIELDRHLAAFAVCKNGLDVEEMQTQMVNAELNFREKKTSKNLNGPIIPDIEHSDLYKTLVNWRKTISEKEGKPAFQVLHTKSIIDICHKLPSNKKNLGKVYGVGKKKIESFGKELLEIIDHYTKNNEVSTDIDLEKEVETKSAPKQPGNSAQQSMELFQKGLEVDEIAQMRDFTRGTILNHLCKFIENGELNPTKLIREEVLNTMADYFKINPEANLSEAKTHFEEQFDYDQLRIGRAYAIHLINDEK